MAKRQPARRTTGRKTTTAGRRPPATRSTSARPRPRSSADPLLADVAGAERRDASGVRIEIGRAGLARIKRVVYPPGFRWSVHMKPFVHTDLCMHAHAGFLARGTIGVEYGDGSVEEYTAPAILAIAPGHDGWVIGRDAAVVIEFDFERETIQRLGMPGGRRSR